VMAGGQIVQEGAFAELEVQEGVFRELVRAKDLMAIRDVAHA